MKESIGHITHSHITSRERHFNPRIQFNSSYNPFHTDELPQQFNITPWFDNSFHSAKWHNLRILSTGEEACLLSHQYWTRVQIRFSLRLVICKWRIGWEITREGLSLSRRTILWLDYKRHTIFKLSAWSSLFSPLQTDPSMTLWIFVTTISYTLCN